MNLSITDKKGKMISCRIFDPANIKWYTGSSWTSVEGNARLTPLNVVVLSNEFENRFVGSITIPDGGPYTVEYIDTSTGLTIAEEMTQDPNIKKGYSLTSEYDAAKTAAKPGDSMVASNMITPVPPIDNTQLITDIKNKVDAIKSNIDASDFSALSAKQNIILDEAILARKLQTNKAVISPDGTIVTIYDDDKQTVLYTYVVSLDQKTRTPQ